MTSLVRVATALNLRPSIQAFFLNVVPGERERKKVASHTITVTRVRKNLLHQMVSLGDGTFNVIRDHATEERRGNGCFQPSDMVVYQKSMQITLKIVVC